MLLLRFINTFYRPHLPSPANAGEELAMCIFKFFLRLFFCVYNFLCILILFLKFKFLIKMKKICLLVSAVLLFDVGVGFAYSPAFSYEEEFSLERAFAVRAKRLSSGSVNRHGLREGGRQMFSSEGDFEDLDDASALDYHDGGVREVPERRVRRLRGRGASPVRSRDEVDESVEKAFEVQSQRRFRRGVNKYGISDDVDGERGDVPMNVVVPDGRSIDKAFEVRSRRQAARGVNRHGIYGNGAEDMSPEAFGDDDSFDGDDLEFLESAPKHGHSMNDDSHRNRRSSSRAIGGFASEYRKQLREQFHQNPSMYLRKRGPGRR